MVVCCDLCLGTVWLLHLLLVLSLMRGWVGDGGKWRGRTGLVAIISTHWIGSGNVRSELGVLFKLWAEMFSLNEDGG